MATVGELQNLPKWRRLVLLLASFLGLVAGLCTVFALVVTAAQGWQEHAHGAMAGGNGAGSAMRPGYLHAQAGVVLDRLQHQLYGWRGGNCVPRYSRSTPAPRRVIWQYPPEQFERLQEWVDAHPEGTPIAVHYDPANHSKAVLVATDMPLGGPRTPGNLRLLGIAAAELRGTAGDRANHTVAIRCG